VLLEWWTGQNVKGRHLWPGNILSHPAAEIEAQLGITRKQAGASGNIVFNASSFLRNRNGVADTLARLYAEPALIPATVWLDDEAPVGPAVKLTRTLTTTGITRRVAVEWSPVGSEKPALWVLQTRTSGLWKTAILPATQVSRVYTGSEVLGPKDAVAVSAVDRAGNQSLPSVITVGDLAGEADDE